MNAFRNRIVGLFFAVSLLSGCIGPGPESPEEVAGAFWTSVVHDDADAILEYSTLKEIEDYDRFSLDDWGGRTVSFEKRVLEDEHARIVTAVSSREEPDAVDLEFSTYLVRAGGRWRVDYEQTARSVRMSAAIGDMFGEIDRLGRELSERFETASRQLSADIQEMAERLRALSESLRRQTSDSIDYYGERLREHIEELERSIERALRERQDDVSDRDRRLLREAAADLHETREPLANPTARTVADSGEAVVATQKRLEQVDPAVFGPYREAWQRQAAKIQADMERLLEELSR